jgi:hypothetical protein
MCSDQLIENIEPAHGWSVIGDSSTTAWRTSGTAVRAGG